MVGVNDRYPVPEARPVYVEPHEATRERRRMPLFTLIASAATIGALVLALWLAGLLFYRGFSGTPWFLLNVLLFWGVVAYLALPRLHQLVSAVYVPNYFIGRARTADGMLGDPINVGLNGTREDVQVALESAGWTRADELTIRSALKMVRASLLRWSYPAAPVSGLYVFDRLQDFAYQQEVNGTTAKRHHVRFWKTPDGWLLPGGERVDWVAGATYDRAVGLSSFTFQITHKIDEDTDVERDYLINTIRFADPQVQVDVIDNFSSAYHSRNGGGDEIRTDGDLPIVQASGAALRHHMPRPPKRATIVDHHIPPVPLLFTGALVLVSLLVSLASVFFESTSNLPYVMVPLVLTVLWWAVVARQRWAWVGLVGLLFLGAVDALRRVGELDQAREFELVVAALNVLAVLAVTAETVRQWVGGDADVDHDEMTPV